MSLVMVVEDEAMLRASMVRSLQRLPGVEVVAASSYAEARAKMLDEWPALLVSDISLPDGSAVGLLAELEAAGLQIPVIFITAYLGRFRDQLPVRDDVEVHEKPVRMRALREWVLQRLNATLDHRRPPFSVTEYLQLAGMGNHSAVVRVARGGKQLGWVRLVKGAPWSARAGDLRGLSALQALAFAPEVRVEVDALMGPPGERELNGSLDAILLDAFRIRDDAVRDGKPDPFDTFKPGPVPPPDDPKPDRPRYAFSRNSSSISGVRSRPPQRNSQPMASGVRLPQHNSQPMASGVHSRQPQRNSQPMASGVRSRPPQRNSQPLTASGVRSPQRNSQPMAPVRSRPPQRNSQPLTASGARSPQRNSGPMAPVRSRPPQRNSLPMPEQPAALAGSQAPEIGANASPDSVRSNTKPARPSRLGQSASTPQQVASPARSPLPVSYTLPPLPGRPPTSAPAAALPPEFKPAVEKRIATSAIKKDPVTRPASPLALAGQAAKKKTLQAHAQPAASGKLPLANAMADERGSHPTLTSQRPAHTRAKQPESASIDKTVGRVAVRTPDSIKDPATPPKRTSLVDEVRFEKAMESGLDALLTRNYSAAWAAFSRAEAVRPGHPVVRANLARIRELGKVPGEG